MRCRSHENVSGVDQRQMSEGNTLEYFEKRYHAKSDIAYHYTSLEAFMSIVQSKTFRLTSLNVTNDTTEASYSFDSYISNLEEVLCEVLDDEFAEKIREAIKAIGKKRIESEINDMQLHALSLSTEKDNMLHWKAYAQAGTGICIGLKTSAISAMARKIKCEHVNKFLMKTKVIYKEDEIKKCILKNIKLGKFILDKCKDLPKDRMQSIIELTMIQTPLFILRKSVKHASFFDEHELRIVFDANRFDNFYELCKEYKSRDEIEDDYKDMEKIAKHLKLNEKLFYLSQYGIKSYRNLCFNEVWGSGVIPEVILGPLCRQNVTELTSFLESNGLYGVEIRESKVPIR